MNRQTNQKPGCLNSGKGLSIIIALIGLVIFCFFWATENYSEGERIGFITKFSHKGRFWKSWEGELNLTQTGMNTSSLFEFSIDNDNESPELIAMIDSAVNNGWKIKLTYHETFLKNWFNNRGETSHFIKSIEVLDRTTPGMNHGSGPVSGTGRVVDTVFVVVDKSEILKNMKEKAGR